LQHWRRSLMACSSTSQRDQRLDRHERGSAWRRV
jgi:hypothetical protein